MVAATVVVVVVPGGGGGCDDLSGAVECLEAENVAAGVFGDAETADALPHSVAFGHFAWRKCSKVPAPIVRGCAAHAFSVHGTVLCASGRTQVITQFAAFGYGGLAASIDCDWSLERMDVEHA